MHSGRNYLNVQCVAGITSKGGFSGKMDALQGGGARARIYVTSPE